MSLVEEDVELRDLLAQTLEKNGCLAKLRAELRASIFLALDEDMKLNKQQPLQNLRIQSYLETPEGRTMFCLVREFLEFFNLQFTISVYEPESYLDSIGQYEGRHKVAKDLGLDSIEEPTVPLLQQLLKIAQTKSKVLDINLNMNNTNGSFKDDSLNIDSSYKKTESCTSNSRISNGDLQHSLEKNITIENLEHGNLNATFDINSPTVVFGGSKRVAIGHQENSIDKSLTQKVCKTYENSHKTSDPSLSEDILEKSSDKQNGSIKTSSLESVKNDGIHNSKAFADDANQVAQNKNSNSTKIFSPKYIGEKAICDDDTYEDTSSIAEDSEGLEKPGSKGNSENIETDVPLSNPSNSNVSDNSAQILSKLDVDKQTLSLQRPKNSLSSLSDLPPLPSNKTRVSNDILPSLYNKDYKNKSPLKELDKMFDMEADYEEDFMYHNEFSLNSQPINLSQSKTNNTLEESLVANEELQMLNMINMRDGRPLANPIQTNCSNSVKNVDHNSSISGMINSESMNSAQ